MSIDQTTVVQAYVDNKHMTVPTLAAQFGIKPTDAGAILRLHGVKIRKGNVASTNNLTPEARAKAAETRSLKALHRQMVDLINKHGAETVLAAYDYASISQDSEAPIAVE